MRKGLRSLIGSLPDFEVIGESCDGEETVRLALELLPTIVLMDLCMPGLDGREASIRIKRLCPEIRIVALTPHKTDYYVREALRAGIDGYLLQEASFDELVLALRSVAEGKRFLSPAVLEHVVDNYLGEIRPDPGAGPWGKLTARERGILKLVAEGQTNRAMAGFLQLSPKTVEKHRASVMRKLGLRSVSELTLVALESGLIEPPGTGLRWLIRGDAENPGTGPHSGRPAPAR